MVSSLARPMLRSPAMRRAGRRYESTAASKAQQGLSKVTSAAGPAISGAARGVGNALSKVGGRTGRLIGFIQAQTPRVVYYGKVGLEVGKLVFNGQKMAPPSMATLQTTYQNLFNSIRSGSLFQSPQTLLQSVRNISTTQLVAGGVVAAECLGFFTVGEMIGRFKLIGYSGEAAHH